MIKVNKWLKDVVGEAQMFLNLDTLKSEDLLKEYFKYLLSMKLFYERLLLIFVFPLVSISLAFLIYILTEINLVTDINLVNDINKLIDKIGVDLTGVIIIVVLILFIIFFIIIQKIINNKISKVSSKIQEMETN